MHPLHSPLPGASRSPFRKANVRQEKCASTSHVRSENSARSLELPQILFVNVLNSFGLILSEPLSQQCAATSYHVLLTMFLRHCSMSDKIK